jgi:hypothetical protein
VADSGGKHFDFTEEAGLTPGEARTLRMPVVDSAGVDVASFAGWEVNFYLLTAANWQTDGTAALSAAAIFERSEIGSPSLDIGTPPNVDVPIQVADWGGGAAQMPLTRARYWYELWRSDTGNVTRLAKGWIEVVH